MAGVSPRKKKTKRMGGEVRASAVLESAQGTSLDVQARVLCATLLK